MTVANPWGGVAPGHAGQRRETEYTRRLLGKPPGGRQVQVIGLVADGFTNEEIAVTLGISADTVKSHLSKSMRKLGARNRAHLVGLAYQQGILSTDTDSRLAMIRSVRLVAQFTASGEGRTLRKALKLSADEVGLACGVAASTICDWERGVVPKPIRAVAYARVLYAMKNHGKLPDSPA